MAEALGARQRQALLDAGGTPEDVQAWEDQARSALLGEGAGQEQVDAYFGKPAFQDQELRDYFSSNLERWRQTQGLGPEVAGPPKAPIGQETPPKQADTFFEAIEAGLKGSTGGMLLREKLPDITLPENAPLAHRAAEAVGTLVGDLPAMIAGMNAGTVIGGAGGAVLGPAGVGAGAIAGGAGGAFALPAGLRKLLVDKYEKGEVTDFQDFWKRAGGILWETTKGFTVGVATGAAGGKAAQVAEKVAAPQLAKMAAPTAAELVTMVTVGRALEGETPQPDDFLLAGTLIVGVKGSIHSYSHVAKKLQKIYVETGAKPYEVAQEVSVDEGLKNSLLSSNIDIPPEFLPRVEAVPGVEKPKMKAVELPESARSSDLADTPTKILVPDASRVVTPPNEGYISRGSGDPSFVEVVDFARAAARDPQKSVSVKLKDGSAIQLVNMQVEGEGRVIALKGSEVIGDLGYATVTDRGGKRFNPDVRVEEAWRRKGVATAMYDVAESSGGLIPDLNQPGQVRLPDGQAFREARAKRVATPEPAKAPAEPTEKLTPEQEIAAFFPVESVTTSSIKEKATKSFAEFYTNRIDYTHPVKLIQDVLSDVKAIPERLDAYTKLRLLPGVESKVHETLKTLSVKMAPALKTPEALRGFEEYLVAARAREINAQGKVSGLSQEAADAIYEKGKSKYAAMAEELYKAKDAALRDLKDSGVLSEEAFNLIVEADKSHVPFHRLVAEDGQNPAPHGSLGSLKTLKGSTRSISSPLDASLGNIRLYTLLAERNRAAKAFFEFLDSTPDGAKFAKKEKTKLRPIEVSAPEVAKFLKSHGIEANVTTDSHAFTLFRPIKESLKDNQVRAFTDGKADVRTVAPEVARALNGEDVLSLGRLMQAMKVFSSTLRTGVTLSPEFMAKNFVRDTMGAYLYTPGFIPGVGSYKGAKLAVEGKYGVGAKEYFEWVDAGGANATIHQMDTQYLQKNIRALEKETGFLSSTVNVVKSVPDLLQAGAELSENATRLGVYKAYREKGFSPQRSAFEARDILDFARHGAKMRAWNQIAAFFNAHVQGLDKLGRFARDNPEALSAKTIHGILAPSLYLWWANQSDPRWSAIPNYQKDLNWILMTDDVIYRIPKPHELGIMFGSIPERVMESFKKDNPKAFKDLDRTMLQAFAPSALPVAASVALELKTNQSFLSGAPIIPFGLEKVLPEDRITSYTSQSAILLGQFMRKLPGFDQFSEASSPVMIDHFVKSWTGGAGQHLLDLTDVMLTKSGIASAPPLPLKKLEDLPIIKAFTIKYPGARSQRVIDFYDRFTKNEQFLNSIKKKAELGEADALEVQARFEKNSSRWVRLTQAAATISQMNQLIARTRVMKDMSPYEKANIIESLYGAMHATADGVETAFEEFEKSMKGDQGAK